MAPPRLPRPSAAFALVLLLAGCGRSEPAASAAATPAADERATATRTQRPGAASCSDPGRGPEPDAAGLRAFVRKRSPQIRDCYQRELKRNASASGKATIRFTIGTCGEVSSASVVARRGRVDGSAACVTSAMRGWQTPFRPAGPVTVEYPFAFEPSM